MKSITLAAALALGSGLAPAFAQDAPVQLRLAHFVPPAHPLQATFEAWGKSLNAASGGSISLTVFPSEQLGKAFDGYDLARDGVADLSLVNPGYQPGRFPLSSAAELPFTISDGKRGNSAVDAWYRAYAPREMKDVHVCVSFLRTNAYFQSVSKPIVVPADVKGMRIRPSDGTIAALVTLLGGTNVQASAPASRDVLERGVADATVFPWGSTLLFGIDKVVKHHLDMPTEMGFFVLAMNKGKYERMSAGQKKAIDAHCNTEWANRIADPWTNFEEAGLEKIAAQPGHVVTKPTAAQVDLWRAAAKPLVEQWHKDAAKAGFDTTKALDDLNASLAKYNAKL